MISAEIKVDTGGLEKRVPKIPAAVLEGVHEGLTALGVELERGMIAAIPHRSGAARKSIGHELRSAGLIPALSVGAIIAPPPYMRILDKGGVIRPRNTRYLTIPIGKARTPSRAFGRFTARQLMSNPESAGYAGAFIRHGIIFGVPQGASSSLSGGARGRKKASGGVGGRWNIEPLFKLVDQVTQKATNGGRGWLQSTVRDALGRGLHREKIDAAVKRKLASVTGAA